MKNIFFIIFPCIALLLCSCEDRMILHTVIEPDGSCTRALTYKVDPCVSDLHDDSTRVHIDYAVANDGTWIRTEEASQTDSFASYITLTRSFDSVEEMSGQLPLQINGQSIAPQCRLDKRFRWFYTEYTFTETYPSLSGFFKVPFDGFLDEEEARFWLTGEPDLFAGYSGYAMKEIMDNLETEFYAWVGANMLSELLDLMVEYPSLYEGAGITAERLTADRDSLIVYGHKQGLTINNFEHVDSLLNMFYGTDVFTGFSKKEANSDIKSAFDEHTLPLVEINTLSIDYQLDMPGQKIIHAGMGVQKDRSVSPGHVGLNYQLRSISLLMPDYTITATTRSVNIWAFVVTILLALASVVLMWVKVSK